MPCSPGLHLHCPKLEVVLLSRDPLRLAFRHNLLAEPLLLEAVVQSLQVLDNVPAGADDCVLGRDGAVSLNAELESREERVRDFVRGEYDVVVLEETLREQVAKRVVLFVEREDGCMGHTFRKSLKLVSCLAM